MDSIQFNYWFSFADFPFSLQMNSLAFYFLFIRFLSYANGKNMQISHFITLFMSITIQDAGQLSWSHKWFHLFFLFSHNSHHYVQWMFLVFRFIFFSHWEHLNWINFMNECVKLAIRFSQHIFLRYYGTLAISRYSFLDVCVKYK